MAPNHRLRHALLSGSLILGAGLGTAGAAAAASGPSTTSSAVSSSSTSTPCPPHAGDPASSAHGPRETLLTGSDLATATAAAEAAVPGSTVLRAEINPSGTYEVHVKKADGTYATVRLDRSFAEISIETGVGPASHGPGPMGPRGDRPTDAPMGPGGPAGPMGPMGPMDQMR
ncbi:MAG: hypothetical protein KGJ39_07880 [Acidobacteriota bacterium]|nr:hypothetical protein [Acidobacteriota bacterium]